MKILIYGTGAVGGYFGARLVQAGNDVTFIARGKHLEAIQKNGLQVKSIDGDFTVSPANITNNISTLSPDFDLIILGVKSWQVLDAAKKIKPILNDKTLVLPIQNGVNNVDKLLSVIDQKNIIAGFCKIYAKIDGFGIINHFFYPPEINFGEVDNSKSDRILALLSTFKKAKFKTVIADDIIADIWKKFMFICAVSGLGALTRVSIGAMVENEETKNLLQKTVEEIYAIGLANGVNLPLGMDKMMMVFILNQPYESTASTQRDIMEARPSELENFNGYIVEQGIKHKIETPVNKFIYGCLLPQERIARNKN